MPKPSTLSEFKAAIYKELDIPFASLFGFSLIPQDLTNQHIIKVEKILRDGFKLLNPILPSSNCKQWILSQYLKEVWENNKSFFEVAIPSNHDPLDRRLFMGRSITRHIEMKTWIEDVEDSEDWNNGWLSKLPYQERKYLIPVRGFEDYEKETPDIQRFRISHIPSYVKFEDCFPTINELYIAHPYKPCIYMPASRYEHLLFRDRIHEMSKVMMALGATEIRTIQNDEYKSFSKDDSTSQTSGSGRVGGWASGSGSYATGTEHSRNTGRESEIVINFKNDPLELPYIPKGLVWFNHESEWQQIAEARLNGNILEYELSLSSKQVNLVSDIERKNIEAQARALCVSGSFSQNTSSCSIFNDESAKSTRILIKFKSRKDY